MNKLFYLFTIHTTIKNYILPISEISRGVCNWALDPFGPGERVTLGRGLVNQHVAPLVEVSGPLFCCPSYTFGIFHKGVLLY
jgi:hypothetical protein